LKAIVVVVTINRPDVVALVEVLAEFLTVGI